MAKPRFTTVMSSTTGLNNVVDPARILMDPRSGTIELSQAVNINIDRSGRPTRRLGRVQKNATAASHGFVHKETCLFVSGTVLYRMKPDYSIVALRSDLTENARMRYFPVANRIYYTNEFEVGYVQNGLNHIWEKGNYTEPGNSRRTFSDPPKGHLIGWFASRLLMAKDNAIYASEPSYYGVFDLFNNVRVFPNTIKMMQPTPQGLWIGTADSVLFFRGQKWRELRREEKAGYGVLEGSDIWCPGEKRGTAGRFLFFTTPQGICVGGEDGSFENITYNKVTFPSGRYANATMAGDRYLVLIEP